MANNTSNEDDDEHFIPLQDQRVFGAGLKRKCVHFVPATKDDDEASPLNSTPQGPSIRDYYLSIVLPKTESDPGSDSKKPTTVVTSESEAELTPQEQPLCPTCHLPLPAPQIVSQNPPHESTLPHQLSLPHSYPPSHLPRQHIGFQYLCAHGWDPDSRAGLGARGEGRRHPVKVKWKGDTVGLGVKGVGKVSNGAASKRNRGEKLGAKEIRKLEEEGKRRGQRLRDTFYGKVDVEKYLGGEG